MIIATPTATWLPACRLDALLPGMGACSLVQGRQVALFHLPDGRIFAIGNRDPLGGANVLSRGIVGDAGGRPMVASPLHKERYLLEDGTCLDHPEVRVPTYPVRVIQGEVLVDVGT
jgi:nitrite reductase (NADH) small subunit